MASEQGYSNQKKKGKAQFKTIHQVNSNAYGESVINKYLFELAPGNLYITDIQDVLGSNGQVEFWKFEVVSHGASVGHMFRIKDTADQALFNFEFEIISVIDSDNFTVLPISEAKPSLGDGGTFWGWVTGAADANGNLIISQGPVQFVKDSTVVQVTEDTLNPLNNNPLPVKLTSVTGDINITANDLNVDIESTRSSVEIGNSAGDKVVVDLNNDAATYALKVKDDDANDFLDSIDDKIISMGFEDPGNSSTTPLPAGGVFTGTAFDITKYAAINVNVKSDVASATNGVKVEFSTDGINWDHSHSTTYSAATGVGYIFNAEFKYARVVYTNDGSPQTIFRLQTIFKATKVQGSLYTLDQTVTGSMFAELNRSTIIGKTTSGGGGFVDVKVNPSGALTVEASLSAGNNNIGDVDVASLPVSFGAGAIDATTQRVVLVNNQTIPISASALPLPSGAATDAKLDSIITAIGSTNTKLDSIELNTSPELNSHDTQTVTSSSAVTFTAPAGAKRMVIQNSLNANGAIRFVASAGTPTASSGFYLGIGQSTSEIPAGSFKAIATNASEDGDVTVIWFV